MEFDMPNILYIFDINITSLYYYILEYDLITQIHSVHEVTTSALPCTSTRFYLYSYFYQILLAVPDKYFSLFVFLLDNFGVSVMFIYILYLYIIYSSYYLLLLLLLLISSPGLRRGHVKKNVFHVMGIGEIREIVNQTVKSDRAIAPLLKTNNFKEGRQVEIT